MRCGRPSREGRSRGRWFQISLFHKKGPVKQSSQKKVDRRPKDEWQGSTEKPMAKTRKASPPPAPPQAKERPKQTSGLTQVQHDSLLAGGFFCITSGILMIVSLVLPWLSLNGADLSIFDLLDKDIFFIAGMVVPFLGGALCVLSIITLFRGFRSSHGAGQLPLALAIMAVAISLLVILEILLLQRTYEGQDALYGAGAFLCVVGAILAMAGAMLMQVLHSKKAKPTGFKALSQRSEDPAGRKEWQPPERSVKAPRCPSCGEEVQPGWKACPVCGHAFISDGPDEQKL